MYRPHPLGVPGSQVVVDRHQMNAPAAQGVQVGGHGGDQGLSLPGSHLGDPSLVKRTRAHHLHVIGALAQYPLGDFTHHRKGFGRQIVEALAPRDPFPKMPVWAESSASESRWVRPSSAFTLSANADRRLSDRLSPALRTLLRTPIRS